MSFQRPGDYISQLLARLPGGVPSPIASRNWLGSPGGAAGGLGYVDQLLEALPGSPASPLDTFDTETLPVTSGSPWGGLSSTASDA
ncbi:MAG TPA: hypothetical protein VF104_07065, partial [Burkholderiales bacterium]